MRSSGFGSRIGSGCGISISGAVPFLVRTLRLECRHPSGRDHRSSISLLITALAVVIGETAVVGNDVTLYHGVTLGGMSWNLGTSSDS